MRKILFLMMFIATNVWAEENCYETAHKIAKDWKYKGSRVEVALLSIALDQCLVNQSLERIEKALKKP